MCAIRILKGDTVKVIAGAEKGLIGTVNSVLRKKSEVFVTISGMRKVVKNVKRTDKDEGGRKMIDRLVHISNVMVFDKSKNLTSRVSYRIDEKGKRRYYKISGEDIV